MLYLVITIINVNKYQAIAEIYKNLNYVISDIYPNNLKRQFNKNLTENI